MKKNSILIIDDEQIITRALSRAFQKENFLISTANDGEEGLQKILSENPALIILDVLMPKLTGLEVLEKIRKSNITTPVILMTAYGDQKTESKAKQLGVFAYLTKPFEDINDIVSLAKQSMEMSS